MMTDVAIEVLVQVRRYQVVGIECFWDTNKKVKITQYTAYSWLKVNTF